MKKFARRALLVLVGLFLLIQVVPYGRSHDNPPVTGGPAWDAPRTEALARRACFDCHSNETDWPWYAHVAPISWLVQHDVDEGREHLNFSTWDRAESRKRADDAAEEVGDGEMPPTTYVLAHPEARLDDTEKAELVRGLEATFGEKRRDRGNDED